MTLIVYIDGACRGNPGASAVGVVIQDSAGHTIKEYHRTIGEQTNNVAEYTALLDAMRLASEMGCKRLKIRSDSQLLVRQFNGQYRVKNERLFKYLVQIQNLRRQFDEVELEHVPRELNRRADRLANDALDAVKKSPDDSVASL